MIVQQLSSCTGDGPIDVYLDVPCYDPAVSDDGLRYRIAHAWVGENWRGRWVEGLAFVNEDGNWFIEVTYAAH